MIPILSLSLSSDRESHLQDTRLLPHKHPRDQEHTKKGMQATRLPQRISPIERGSPFPPRNPLLNPRLPFPSESLVLQTTLPQTRDHLRNFEPLIHSCKHRHRNHTHVHEATKVIPAHVTPNACTRSKETGSRANYSTSSITVTCASCRIHLFYFAASHSPSRDFPLSDSLGLILLFLINWIFFFVAKP